MDAQNNKLSYLIIDNSQKYNLTKSIIPEADRLFKEEEQRKIQLNYSPSLIPTVSVRNKKDSYALDIFAEHNNVFPQLDDRAVDVLDYISAKFIKLKPQIGEVIELSIDDILLIFGLKKRPTGDGDRRAGYTIEQRKRIYDYICSLSKIGILIKKDVATSKKGKKQTALYDKEYLFTIPRETIAIDVDTMTPDVKHVTIRVENFFRQLLFELNQTKPLPVKLLQYDPYRRKYAKRIGKYLYRQKDKIINHHVSTIINSCHISIDSPRKDRVKRNFDDALKQLQEDGFIREYNYLDVINTRNSNWFERWQEAQIRITLI